MFKQLDPFLPVQIAEVFLEIAQNEGVTIADLQQRLGIAKPTISRHVQYLSRFYKPGQAGLNLVETRESPADRRAKEVHLSRSGKLLLNMITGVIDGEELTNKKIHDEPGGLLS